MRGILWLACGEAYQLAMLRAVVQRFDRATWQVFGGELARELLRGADASWWIAASERIAFEPSGRCGWRAWVAAWRPGCDVAVVTWTGEGRRRAWKLVPWLARAREKIVYNENLDAFEIGAVDRTSWRRHVRWRLRSRHEALDARWLESGRFAYKWTGGLAVSIVALAVKLAIDGPARRSLRARRRD